MTMQFKSLMIRRLDRYEDPKQPITGKITMDGLSGEVTVKLTEDQAREILTIVSRAARETTEAAMRAMTADVFALTSQQDAPALLS